VTEGIESVSSKLNPTHEMQIQSSCCFSLSTTEMALLYEFSSQLINKWI